MSRPLNCELGWSLLVRFTNRKTTTQYDGRRSNGLQSTTFCLHRAFDRQANFPGLRSLRAPDNILEKETLVKFLEIIRSCGNGISLASISSPAVVDTKNYNPVFE
jgi:hypothetical protein